VDEFKENMYTLKLAKLLQQIAASYLSSVFTLTLALKSISLTTALMGVAGISIIMHLCIELH